MKNVAVSAGSCQCNSIRYEVSGPLTDCCYCHCSICRKLTGSSMGVYGTIKKDKLVWLAGEGLLSSYQQNEALLRMFCSLCGSTLASTHALSPSKIYLALGCLDDQQNIKIDYQQFVESKASWVTVDRAIEAHAGWPEWIKQRIE